MPQAAMVDSPGSSRIKPSPVRNALGAQVIGSTPRPVRKCGAGWVWGGVELDEGIVLVGPDRGLPPVRAGQPDPGQPVGVAGQAGEGEVHVLGADRAFRPEVDISPLDVDCPGG
jgi:hypothetical protein